MNAHSQVSCFHNNKCKSSEFPRMLRPPSLLGRVASVIQRMQHAYTVRGINPPHDQSFVTPEGACKLLDGHPPRSHPPRRTLGLSPISASRFALKPPKRLQRVWFNMCVLSQFPLRALLARSQHIHRIVSQFSLTKLIFGGVVVTVALLRSALADSPRSEGKAISRLWRVNTWVRRTPPDLPVSTVTSA